MKSRRRRKALSRVAGRPTPLLVFGALLSASLAMRCASKSDTGDADTTGGSSNQGGDTANGGASNGGSSNGGSSNGGSSNGGSSNGGSASGGIAGDVGTGGVISTGGTQSGSCTVANVANDCPLPPSVCQDTQRLTYFSAPECLEGRCTYTQQSYLCPGGFCSAGFCGSSTTTTSMLPPPDPRCVGGMSGTGSGGMNGGGGAGGAMGARIIFAGAGFGAVGGIAVGGQSGGGGMSGVGAMGSTSCDLPASFCINETTLAYYTMPYCDAFRQCKYMTNTLDCMGPCTNGACQGGPTAPAPP